MAKIQTNVTNLLKLGADAMSNMFDVEIRLPSILKNKIIYSQHEESLRFRVDGFNIPKGDVPTYEIKYKGISIKKPRTEINLNREFDLTFRIDAAYDVYKLLKAWVSLVNHPATGYFSNSFGRPDPADPSKTEYMGEVFVYAYNNPYIATSVLNDEGLVQPSLVEGVTDMKSISANPNKIVWEFYQVIAVSIAEPTYKHDSANAITAQVKFIFGEYVDPLTAVK